MGLSKHGSETRSWIQSWGLWNEIHIDIRILRIAVHTSDLRGTISRQRGRCFMRCAAASLWTHTDAVNRSFVSSSALSNKPTCQKSCFDLYILMRDAIRREQRSLSLWCSHRCAHECTTSNTLPLKIKRLAGETAVYVYSEVFSVTRNRGLWSVCTPHLFTISSY